MPESKLYRQKLLVEVAKEMGFSNAEVLFWPADNPEIPLESWQDSTEDVAVGEPTAVLLGISLGSDTHVVCNEIDDGYATTAHDTHEEAKAEVRAKRAMAKVAARKKEKQDGNHS